VSFDLYIIRTWDGNGTMGGETWDLTVGGGPTLLHTGFSNMEEHGNPWQAYPDTYPGGNNPARTGAAEIRTLGFLALGYGIEDTVYNISYTFNHSSSSLEINFTGAGLQSVDDESWGLDNVSVTAIPEPGTLLLLAPALLGVAGVLRRKFRNRR
jgi:hypothetical protein